MPTDFAKLRLKHHGDAAMMHEILRLECREKCARKLPTYTTIEGFDFPSLAVAEMATSEAVAEIHAEMVKPGERVLDMTFGLGIDSFALARMGAEVTAIELDETCYEAGLHNIELLHLPITLYKGDSVNWLREHPDEKFGTIFVDPARRNASGRHTALADCSPDLTECIALLRERADRVIIKTSPMLDVTLAMRELRLVRADISIIGTRRECKEVVIDISEHSTGRVRCITVGEPTFEFGMSSQAAACAFTEPQVGDMLLEPWPAVMKAASLGAMNAIEGVSKLAPNTHLFTSPTADTPFPGEQRKIIDIIPFNKCGERRIRAAYPEINIATRNFPLSAPALAARLKIREGGSLRLHGCTLASGKKVMIVTE